MEIFELNGFIFKYILNIYFFPIINKLNLNNDNILTMINNFVYFFSYFVLTKIKFRKIENKN